MQGSARVIPLQFGKDGKLVKGSELLGMNQACCIEGVGFEEQDIVEQAFGIDLVRKCVCIDVDDQIPQVFPDTIIDSPQNRCDDLPAILCQTVAPDADDRGGRGDIWVLADDGVHVPVIAVVPQVVHLGEGVG